MWQCSWKDLGQVSQQNSCPHLLHTPHMFEFSGQGSTKVLLWDSSILFFLVLGGSGRNSFSIRNFRVYPPQRILSFQFLDASRPPSISNSLGVNHLPSLLCIHFFEIPCLNRSLYRVPFTSPQVTGSAGSLKLIFLSLGILGPARKHFFFFSIPSYFTTVRCSSPPVLRAFFYNLKCIGGISPMIQLHFKVFLSWHIR